MESLTATRTPPANRATLPDAAEPAPAAPAPASPLAPAPPVRSRRRLAEPLLSELAEGRPAPAPLDGRARALLPEGWVRDRPVAMPALPESEVVRHFTRLSRLNYGVDNGMYPLGSCTMKFNPKVCDEVALAAEAAFTHPLALEEAVQGNMEVMWRLERWLGEILGMDAVTLEPAAGAHGEFLGLLIVRAYHEARGDGARTEVVVPDTAHGTNPASAAMLGYTVVEVPSTPDGVVDLAALRAAVGPRTACIMLTNPNTLGIFESDIREMAAAVHAAGGLLYYDGANLNAIMGVVRPGDMGFDIVHTNLHKTFAVPHGGGGPGAGPVGVKKRLEPFLPVPRVAREERDGAPFYRWDWERPQSVGKIHSFWGNYLACLRAFAYMRLHGADGLRAAAQVATLNANWLKWRTRALFDQPGRALRKHEFVVSASNWKRARGLRALDLAKRLLDYGVHAPTVYFPLVVPEALMVEPTETESLDELERYARILEAIWAEDPEIVRTAPHTTPVGRLDEALAARKPVLTWHALDRVDAHERA